MTGIETAKKEENFYSTQLTKIYVMLSLNLRVTIV